VAATVSPLARGRCCRGTTSAASTSTRSPAPAMTLLRLTPTGPTICATPSSTWLEDAGIPARVIDELMGHQRSRHGELEGGSRIGARYRHTTPEMAVRVAPAIQERLFVVVQIAEAVLELDDSGGRVF
jgi:hypothetical protein